MVVAIVPETSMSPRQRLEVMVRTERGSQTVWSPNEVRHALDAYRAEVLREAANIAIEKSWEGPDHFDPLQEVGTTLRRMADQTDARARP